MRALARDGRGLALRAVLALLLLVGAAWSVHAAELAFPSLTGRVVDGANLLDAEQRAALEAKLKAHEDRTSDQVVVATVPSLQGTTVEDYANRLFRAWRLGQAKTNNGLLLLVAPSERKVRIEVGYGLEGAMTDALSRVVIASAITPRFKDGDFPGGIRAGVDGILSILAGDAETWQRKPKVRADEVDPAQAAVFVVLFLVVLIAAWRMNRAGGRRRGGGIVFLPGSIGTGSGGWSGGYSGGGSFGGGGGFSGGGGSSGGGGASGGW